MNLQELTEQGPLFCGSCGLHCWPLSFMARCLTKLENVAEGQNRTHCKVAMVPTKLHHYVKNVFKISFGMGMCGFWKGGEGSLNIKAESQ